MDVLLEACYPVLGNNIREVSILIVMDVLLEEIVPLVVPQVVVSILIVMDVLLEVKRNVFFYKIISFNPYCNGCTSRRMTQRSLHLRCKFQSLL